MSNWLASFADKAKETDQFRDRPDRLRILAAGLYGEAGSVLAELKKTEREGEAYPHFRQRLVEEVGDFLWYFARMASETDPLLLDRLPDVVDVSEDLEGLRAALTFGAAVGDVAKMAVGSDPAEVAGSLLSVWAHLALLSRRAGVSLEAAASRNLEKTLSRWPTNRQYCSEFDGNSPTEEQIPRRLTIEFLERQRGTRLEVLLQYEGVTIGDRLTDNISDPDGYRFHDVFHIAYAVFLGWSPVARALFRCKRKSKPNVDENEDGARAAILEEAVSALVFSRAKNMQYFDGAQRIDYDLLKSIQELIRGYEVAQVPVWQWEVAILEGFRAFRMLLANRGGTVSWDQRAHRLEWVPRVAQ